MVRVLHGADRGRYPHGNSMLVTGRSEVVLIDPSLAIGEGGVDVGPIDRILISHCHEDHLAGLHKFPQTPVHVHAADHVGLRSLDGLMQIYGMAAAMEIPWRAEVVDRFHYVPRPDATTFQDGDRFELGGVTIDVIPLPGHTRGHCGFLVEPEGVMFLADIDLTGFGPYYGDAWSSLDAFEQSIARCREIEAARYVTFHHKGEVSSRAELLPLLDDYHDVIRRREQTMLTFLREPRTLDEMVAHRFVYRTHVDLLFVDAVERRSAALHLERLLAQGRVTLADGDRYVATSGR